MRESYPALLPSWLRRYPGAVLRISHEGVVLDSNGSLERELGREVVGRRFAELLDAGSSGTKWERILAGALAPAEEEPTWELILGTPEALSEPRSFSVLREEEGGRVWLLEHRPDPRLDRLREQVTEVNSELAGAQRELVKERGRLAHTLAELEAKNRETERLSATLREQNEELETQNEVLLAMADELRARSEELERSNRALDEFAHAVSHDLKAPLRSIGSYAAWLEEDLAGALTGAAREHLTRLQNRVARMRALIQGVLDYARAGSNRAPPEAVEVEALLVGVVELIDPPAEVSIEIAPGMPTLETERAPLQQVLQNLVSNAVRHARTEAPRVEIACREVGGFHEFSVTDNGPGIPERQRERIWTLFHTLEPEERAEGTGIGLAVVKRIVEARGGTVWVEPDEGAGATFRFLWPAACKQGGARDPRST